MSSYPPGSALPPVAIAVLTALALAWPAQAQPQPASISVALEPASAAITVASAVNIDIVVENAAGAAIRAFEIHLEVADPEDSVAVFDARPETPEIEIREQGDGMALDGLVPLREGSTDTAEEAQYFTVRNLAQEGSGTITYAVSLLGSPDRAASLAGDRLVLGTITLLGQGPGTARIFFRNPAAAVDAQGAPLLDDSGNPIFEPAVKLVAFQGDGKPVPLAVDFADRSTPAATVSVGEVIARASLRQDAETLGGENVAVVTVDLDGISEAASGAGIAVLDDATGGLTFFRATISYIGGSPCLSILGVRSDLGGFSVQQPGPGILVVESADMGGILTPSETSLARLAVRLTGSAAQPCNLEIQDAEFRLGSGAVIPEAAADRPVISLRRGDANGDGLVDVRDARRIARHLAGLADPPLLPVNCASVAYDNGGDWCDERDIQSILDREVGRADDSYNKVMPP